MQIFIYESHLGYNGQNWKELQRAIIERAGKYPAIHKGKDQYGTSYEQKIILYGLKGTPANALVGWIHHPDGTTLMTTTHLDEVK